ncbi:hypothetical protein TCA2_2681 [Paenibacillus sp. TCA20]|nr:hypothetical protein TCA2_2681 [Paenibacillus sp. TCA20]
MKVDISQSCQKKINTERNHKANKKEHKKEDPHSPLGKFEDPLLIYRLQL